VLTADLGGSGLAAGWRWPGWSGSLRLPGDRGQSEAGLGLLDRETERVAIDHVLRSARDGFSASLVIRGDPGVGKTALLGYAAGSASDMRVYSVAGIQIEIGLEFAALHQLLIPFLPEVAKLPGPQRLALQAAFGMAEGPSADLFLVGLAALTLLARAAEEQPMLCLIDDGQWLDVESARALAFVARRLYADRVGMVIAVSEPAPPHTFEQLPAVRIDGLPAAQASQLLRSVARAPVDNQVVDRILADTERNPLALVEVGAEFTADELAGRAALPEPMPLGRRLADRFLRQAAGLHADTRAFLLLAAADVSGDRAVLWRAAQHGGIDAETAAAAANSAGLIELTAGSVRFRHPMIRSAVYHGAADWERRRVHLLLGGAMDSSRDPDLRAWHLGAAVDGPEEEVACELECAADRARERGGYAARAALLRRSVELSAEGDRRAGRELKLADAELRSGHPGAAQDLVHAALPRLADPRARAQAERLRGDLLFARGNATESAEVLASAARSLADMDQGAAREAMAAAMRVSIWAGPLRSRQMAAAAKALPRPDRSRARVADLLLEGYAARFTAGYAAAIRPLRSALSRLQSEDLDPVAGLECYTMGALAAAALWDDSALIITGRFLRAARAQGALSVMPVALACRAVAECLAGRLVEAQDRWTEMRELMAASGGRPVLGIDGLSEGLVLAYTGRFAEAEAAGVAQIRESTARGLDGVADVGRAVVAIADLCAGDYDAAVNTAMTAIQDDPLLVTETILPELIEAACRSYRRREATIALDTLSERALAVGTPWALGVRSRCAALLSDGDLAERAYREAINNLEHSPAAVELARAHLQYGQWLRRSRRRRDARRELRAAYDMFDHMGAEQFAARAATELSATGERARSRTRATNLDLTPQEARVAGLAAGGERNNQIAAQLFISPRTVEYHLGKVFRKLGVNSRAQLARRLPAPRANGPLSSVHLERSGEARR
jgi:DNA-binding CsgD family transcriptional regulator